MASLNQCKNPNCRKYGILNEQGYCGKCKNKKTLKPKTIKLIPFGDSVMPVDDNGVILDMYEWSNFNAKCQSFYRRHSKFEISLMNKSRKKSKITNKLYGYIYLLKSETGSFKFGRTSNINKRLKSYERTYPIKINLVYFIEVENMIDAETAILRNYKESQLQGEWFDVTLNQVEWFINLNNEIVYDTRTLINLMSANNPCRSD